MIPANIKQIILDKKLLAVFVFIAAALIASITMSVYTGNYSNANASLKTQIERIRQLAGSVMDLKSTVEAKENKIRPGKSKGAVAALESVLTRLGLKASGIKPLDKKKVNEYMDEKADLELKNTDLNSIVNLLYRLENSSVPMKINTTVINASFEDPSKFDIRISVSLLSK